MIHSKGWILTCFILFFKFVGLLFFSFSNPSKLIIANMDCHYREFYIYIYSGLSLSLKWKEFFIHEITPRDSNVIRLFQWVLDIIFRILVNFYLFSFSG